MSFGPYRKQAAQRLDAIITQSRIDLERTELDWFVTQQTPTDEPELNKMDVVGEISSLAAEDPHWTHIEVFNLEGQEKQLVISTPGIIQLGERMAEAYLEQD